MYPLKWFLFSLFFAAKQMNTFFLQELWTSFWRQIDFHTIQIFSTEIQWIFFALKWFNTNVSSHYLKKEETYTNSVVRFFLTFFLFPIFHNAIHLFYLARAAPEFSLGRSKIAFACVWNEHIHDEICELRVAENCHWSAATIRLTYVCIDSKRRNTFHPYSIREKRSHGPMRHSFFLIATH